MRSDFNAEYLPTTERFSERLFSYFYSQQFYTNSEEVIHLESNVQSSILTA